MNQKIGELRKEGDLEVALALCKKILADKKNFGEKKELLRTYIQTGNLLSNLSRVKESFEYLELAESINKNLKSSLIEAKIHAQYGKNYDYLG